jgi:Class II Aldolase and Adducin N-terminal domain/Bacterial extracellular solute-binding protein, family 7
MAEASPSDATLRDSAVAAVRRLEALGMNRGSTGNVSLRQGDGMLITPTGMGADDLRGEDMVWRGWDGTLRGAWQPSSEWHFHQEIYLARPQLNAIVHTHSVHAAALACLRWPLPSFHYMVAVAGGNDVPCVPYHLFGTEALSSAVAAALEADLEFSWNQRFDKVSKVVLQMNAVFMPFAAIVSGRIWQTFSAADKELITKTVKETLDEQIDGLAANEPTLIENFKKAPIPIRQVAVADTEAVIAAFDKIWLPQAPVITSLRKIGASMA